MFCITEIPEAYSHAFVSHTRLVPVGTQKPVPQRQVKTEVGVGLVIYHGVMHPVHFRGHDDPAQHAVQTTQDTYVAMVEHRCGIQEYLEYNHAQHRRTQHLNYPEFDHHG